MTDMLVKLYELPSLIPSLQEQKQQSIMIRRSIAPEKHIVTNWVYQHFGAAWHSEVDVAYSRQPISCFVAIQESHLIGFGVYDATALGFFGPTGVDDSARGKGVGKAILLACLHSMAQLGYGYAIIGGVGPIDFYNKIVGATVIPDSTPGIYNTILTNNPNDSM